MTENRALKNAVRRRMETTGEKYTQARRAVLDTDVTETGPSREAQEARRLGHGYIGCEHVLLGLLADEDSLSGAILARHGVTLEIVRSRVEEICGRGEGEDASDGLSYTPRATVVHRLAAVEAERLGELVPRDPHMLLAVLTEGAGVANFIFRDLNVDVASLREDLLEALEVPADLRQAYVHQRSAVEQARRASGGEPPGGG